MAANLGCSVVFLRGAQEEMWQKALSLQFALTPLDVLDWMLGRGLAAIIEAYGASVAEGRIACRNGPLEIARWTRSLRERQAAHAGHAELLNSLKRATLGADGAMVLSAAGVDADRPLDEQADAFWWNAQSDAALDAALARAAAADWRSVARLVRGAGPAIDGRLGRQPGAHGDARPARRGRARSRRRHAGADRTLGLDDLDPRQAHQLGGIVDAVQHEQPFHPVIAVGQAPGELRGGGCPPAKPRAGDRA